MNPFKPYIKKYRLPFIASVLVLGIEAVCDVLQPTLLAQLIDKGVASGKIEVTTHYGLLMLLVTAIGAVSALLRNYISSVVSYKASKELRSDVFDHVVHMSPTQRLRYDQGTLLTRLTNDVVQLQNFVTGLMRIFLKAPLLGLGSMLMVYRLSPELFQVFLILLPIMTLLIALNLKFGYPLYLRVQKSLDALSERIREYFSGIRVVRAFHRFELETQKFKKVNQDSAQSLGDALKRLSVFGPLMSLLVQLSIVYILYLSQGWVLKGHLSLGMLMAFIQYMLQFLFALMIINRVFNLFVRAKGSAQRIGELLILEREPYFSTVPEIADEGAFESIVLEEVSFSYFEGEVALDRVSIALHKGGHYGLIGSTGSGKSTLLQLLMGFYSPLTGDISVDGKKVTREELIGLRRHIGYVPQKSLLFTGTIADNLRFGNPEATYEAMDDAARVAQIKNFISESPLGYETAIGRGGITVSGGQKQRLAIARALMIQPNLLILDDSTSALDSMTEHRFREALRQEAQEMTTLVVSQRISSVIHSDHIFVMADGRIEATGKHEDLLSQSATYRDLFETQLGKEDNHV